MKTTIRYHLTPVGWLLSRRLEITRVGENVEKKELLCTGNANWCIHYGKQYGGSSKKIKNRIII